MAGVLISCFYLSPYYVAYHNPELGASGEALLRLAPQRGRVSPPLVSGKRTTKVPLLG